MHAHLAAQASVRRQNALFFIFFFPSDFHIFFHLFFVLVCFVLFRSVLVALLLFALFRAVVFCFCLFGVLHRFFFFLLCSAVVVLIVVQLCCFVLYFLALSCLVLSCFVTFLFNWFQKSNLVFFLVCFSCLFVFSAVLRLRNGPSWCHWASPRRHRPRRRASSWRGPSASSSGPPRT